MANTAYLRLIGAKQGEIKGSTTHNKVPGQIAIRGAHDLVTSVTGPVRIGANPRNWAPFTIIKEVDHSTPLLYAAMFAAEVFTTWELTFFSPIIGAAIGTASEASDMIVRLGGATVASIELTMPDNRIPELMKLGTYETIGFAFQSFEIAWIDGGITAKDTFGTAKP